MLSLFQVTCIIRHMLFEEPKYYRISEITELVKGLLENSFPDIRLEGEISNFRPSSTGHLYFTLKDKSAMISAVMFKGTSRYLQFRPADGQLVRVTGRISVYPQRGTYQIICNTMNLAGEGDILLMLEERKRRLAAEGLFDEVRKKTIPMVPSKVAVVTSPTGAAIRDILKVIKRRNSGINLIILPAAVQGEGAAEKIARQIKVANHYNMADVLIIGRGGGSLEDLLPFSDEQVVRAVADSKIPVISAVGHEVDISLADLAADRRAATPSHAAEMVAENRDQLISRIEGLTLSINQSLKGRIEKIKLLLQHFDPRNLEQNFRRILQPYMLRLDDAKDDLVSSFKDQIKDMKYRIAMAKKDIEANNPRFILDKGFALVTDKKTGKVISHAGALSPDDEVSIQFAEGTAAARITEIEK